MIDIKALRFTLMFSILSSFFIQIVHAYPVNGKEYTLTYVNEQVQEANIYLINPLYSHKNVNGIDNVCADGGIDSESIAQFRFKNPLTCSIANVLVLESNGLFKVELVGLTKDNHIIGPDFFSNAYTVTSPEEVNQLVNNLLSPDYSFLPN